MWVEKHAGTTPQFVIILFDKCKYHCQTFCQHSGGGRKEILKIFNRFSCDNRVHFCRPQFYNSMIHVKVVSDPRWTFIGSLEKMTKCINQFSIVKWLCEGILMWYKMIGVELWKESEIGSYRLVILAARTLVIHV